MCEGMLRSKMEYGRESESKQCLRVLEDNQERVGMKLNCPVSFVIYLPETLPRWKMSWVQANMWWRIHKDLWRLNYRAAGFRLPVCVLGPQGIEGLQFLFVSVLPNHFSKLEAFLKKSKVQPCGCLYALFKLQVTSCTDLNNILHNISSHGAVHNKYQQHQWGCGVLQCFKYRWKL